MGLFCTRCKSLMPPGTVRCRNCGFYVGDAESTQKSLTEMVQRKEKPAIVPTGDMKMPFFPYEPREFQTDIVNDIVSALSESRHIVMESGTGTGKTICSLSGGLQHARKTGKKILYLTRTISQSDQVMNELHAISQHMDVSGITLTGRKRSCPMLRTMKGYEDISPKALSTICEEMKTKSNRGSKGCKFYEKTKQNIREIEMYCRQNHPTSEELDRYCESMDVCPYEAKKALIPLMEVIVAPYVHILSEDIRSNLLVNMKCSDDEILMIVDEAHNLIDAAREQESFAIRMKSIESAISECDSIKDGALFEDVHIKDILNHLRSIIRSIATERLTMMSRESELSANEVEDSIQKRFQMTHSDLKAAMDRMIDIGESLMERMLDQGNHRISEIYMIGALLKDWITSPDGQYVKTIKADDDGEYIQASCIEPKDIIWFMRSLKGAIHMSGTLQPLEQYVRTIGLPATTVMRIYPSPFPPGNRKAIYIRNMTTRYEDMKRDPSIFTRMERNIARLCNSVERNTLVFFPSYSMMHKMRPFLERDVKKQIYWEESKQQRRTMASLDEFRRGRNGVFFTVMGGSIAEGIDFPGDELSFAIIVGIPYPPPTLESKAMSKMYDERYGIGTGWKYTSEVPALRKMKQAIGRLIRTETDRGMAIIMDSRASKYERQLDAKVSEDPINDAIRFFE